MSRLSTDARLPQTGGVPALLPRLYELFRNIATQVNALSEGSITASTSAATAAPVTGKFSPGDFIRNTAPAEMGAAGSKYVIEGWMCIEAPATFVQKRFLTGN